MKDVLEEFAFFIFRCILAGLIILICAGIIYGMFWYLCVLTGVAPMEGYSFGYQYVQAGFWIGFFFMVRDLKELWRY